MTPPRHGIEMNPGPSASGLSAVLREGGLRFDFSSSRGAFKLDEPGRGFPAHMKPVDFVVAEASRVLLIEIKDPRSIAEFLRNPRETLLSTRPFDHAGRRSFVDDELVPKARGSYTWLHLMNREAGPFEYVVFIGPGVVEEAMLLPVLDAVRRGVRHEAGASEPWRREYVREVRVLTEASWAKWFPEYPLTRV